MTIRTVRRPSRFVPLLRRARKAENRRATQTEYFSACRRY